MIPLTQWSIVYNIVIMTENKLNTLVRWDEYSMLVFNRVVSVKVFKIHQPFLQKL